MYRLFILINLLLQILSQRYVEIADSFKNYSSTQNLNGWNYGYYKDSNPRAIFNDFLPASSGGAVSPSSWKIPNNYCQINKDSTHPATGPGSACSSTAFGLCKTSLKWTKPEEFSDSQGYNPYKIWFRTTAVGTCGDGVKVKLLVNDELTLSQYAGAGALKIDINLNFPELNSLEYIHEPLAGCNCDSITYGITVYGTFPSVSPSPSTTSSASITLTPTQSITVSSSASVSVTSSVSSSVSVSVTSSVSSSPSVTTSYSPSMSPSESASEIYEYYEEEISPSDSPSSSPSSSVTPSLSNTVSSSASISKSPSSSSSSTSSATPSISSSKSPSSSSSSTASATPSISFSKTLSPTPSLTSSLTPSASFSKTMSRTPSITPSNYPPNDYNCFAHNGITITSRSYVRTNPSGQNYVDNMRCLYYINSRNGLVVSISYISFNSENGYDYWKVYDGPSTSSPLLQTLNGVNLSPSGVISSGHSMTLEWTSDISVVYNGVVALIDFVLPIPSPSVSGTSSVTKTASLSPSITSSPSISMSSSSSISNTKSLTPSVSSSPSVTKSPSSSASISKTSSVTLTPSVSISGSVSVTTTPSKTSQPTISITRTISTSNTPSNSVTGSITPSPSTSATMTPPNRFDCVTSIHSVIRVKSFITSNDNRGTYENFMDCQFLIEAPYEMVVRLNYNYVNTEACCDFWKVYDGGSEASPLLQSISGFVIPKKNPLISSGRQMFVQFISDDSITEAGVQALVDFIPASVTPTPSRTGSISISTTISPSNSPSASLSPSITLTQSKTITLSPSKTQSSSISVSPSNSVTASISPSISISVSSSPSKTISGTITKTSTITVSPSLSPSVSPSVSVTSSVSISPSTSRSPSVSPSVSITPSVSTSPSTSRSPSVSTTSSPSISSSVSISPSVSTTSSPSISSSVSPSVSVTSSLSISPSTSRSPSNSVTASASISVTASASVSVTVSCSISVTTSVTVSPSISVTPSISSSVSVTVSSSTSVSPSVSASVSSSTSVSPSSTTSRSSSVSSSSSPSSSVSNTKSPSISVTTSPSSSSSVSISSSVSGTVSISPSASLSPSSTGSSSMTVSASKSSSASASVSATTTGSSSSSASSTASASSSSTISATNSASSSVTSSSSKTSSSTATSSPSITATVTKTAKATNSPIPQIVIPKVETPALNSTNDNITVIQELTIPMTQVLEYFDFSATLSNLPEGTQPPLVAYESDLGPVLLQAQPPSMPYVFDFSSLNSDSDGPSITLALPASDIPRIVEVSVVSASDFLDLLPESSKNITLSSSILSISQYTLSGEKFQPSEDFTFTLPLDPIIFASVNLSEFAPDCIYLDRVQQKFVSDGCNVDSYSNTSVLCRCSHMTEFSSRFSAVAEMNNAIFANLVAQLQKPFIYTVVGPIMGGLLILTIIAFYLDEKSYVYYEEALKVNQEIQFIEENFDEQILYNPVRNKNYNKILKNLERKISKIKSRKNLLKTQSKANLNEENELSSLGKKYSAFKLCVRRLPFKHSYFAWIYSFDPLFPRAYRMLHLVCGLITSLFTTALFYGFKNGLPGPNQDLPKLELSETVVLSLITFGVNIPIMKILKHILNISGKSEYKYRFPNLWREFQSRCDYEKHIYTKPLKIITSEKIKRNDSNIGKELLERLKGDSGKFENYELMLSNLEGLYRLSELNETPFKMNIPFKTSKPSWIHKLTYLHSKSSIFALSIIFGWITWCLFYFISFGMYQKEDNINTLLQTFGQNQIISIFIVQPLQLVLILFILNLVKKLKEKCVYSGKSSFISLSNPLKNKYSTVLSNSLGHLLFVHAPAKCSQLYVNSKVNIPVDIIMASNGAVFNFIQNHNKIENNYSSRELTILTLYYIEKMKFSL